MKDKIIVSTDIGSDPDDALSILAMMNAGLNIEAIYTTNAKDISMRSYIAKHMANLAQKNIVVAQGEAQPLYSPTPPYWFFEECFVDDSFIDDEASLGKDIEYISLEDAGIVRNGLEDLAARLEEEHIIFSLGPLTNIARLLEKYPLAIKNINKLYVMGGNIAGGMEHNIHHDCGAAEFVFNKDIPLTIVPQETCQRFKMPAAQLENLTSVVGEYVKHMTQGYLGAKTALNLGKSQVAHRTKEEFDYMRQNPLFTSENYKKLQTMILQRRILFENVKDPFFGAFQPKEYFQTYKELIEHLRDSDLNYKNGKELARLFENILPHTLSIADAYVPYCFLHPDRIAMKKGTLKGHDVLGSSQFDSKGKHDVVFDIDYNHFAEFLKANLK